MLRGQKMAPARHLKKYPSGPRYQMTQEWKDDVLTALAARGKNAPWLAEQLGVRRGMVHKMFAKNPDGSMKQVSSALVPRICALLDVRHPTVATSRITDGRPDRARELVSALTPQLQELAISMLEALLRGK